MNIVIYTKSNCPNCVSAKQLLKSKGLGYWEFNTDEKVNLDELQNRAPDARQMPQIFVNGVRIGGLAGLQAYLPDILAGRVA